MVQICVHSISYTNLLSLFSYVQLFETLWTIPHQVPLFMGFSRQEYWSGFPCPPPGDLSKLGIIPMSLTSPALAGRFFTTSATWGAHLMGTEFQFRKVKYSGDGWRWELHNNVNVSVTELYSYICPTLCNLMGCIQSKEFSRPEYWSG